MGYRDFLTQALVQGATRVPESDITPIVLKKRVLFILCFYYDVMGYFRGIL